VGAVINTEQLKAAFSRIEELAQENRNVSQQISEGIKAFERRLQRLEGRLAARVSQKSNDGVMTLSFEQQGSQWRLLYTTKSNAGVCNGGELLTAVSVDRQMAAIRMLPLLLEEMIKAHERRGEELAPALETIADLGIMEVGMYADD